MEDFKKEIIKSENGVLLEFNILRKTINSGKEKCICKIMIKENSKSKSATGFICYIKQYNKKVILTNNHVINEDFLKNEKKLKILINNEKKEINLELQRYKSTDKEIDYTIIEIREEDGINDYLEIDEDIYQKNYKNEIIFSEQFPRGDKLNYSHGKIITKNKNLFLYSLATEEGSSGSPIILFNNSKVIGMHRGFILDKKNNRINIGIPINIIIGNIIKCIYEINGFNLNKQIQIINNGYYDKNNKFIETNKEIKNKFEIMINGKIKSNTMKYKFNKRGYFTIFIIIRKRMINMSCMFSNCDSLKLIDLSNFKANNITNMSKMFYNCKSLKSINLSKFNTNNVTDMSKMFSDCESLKSIDLSSFNTNNVTNMSNMFSKCYSLKSIDLSNFNTNNVTNMSWMFSDCDSLKSIDLSHFNNNNLIDMSRMFYNCESLESVDLSNFNANNVTDMSWAFSDCKLLKTINLSNFKTNNHINMSCMLSNCKSLEFFNLSNFNDNNSSNKSKIISMSTNNNLDKIFYDYKSLESINLSKSIETTIYNNNTVYSIKIPK